MKKDLPKIFITGANGQLAQTLCKHISATKYQIFAFAHFNLDITNKEQLMQTISQIKPDYVINTAAYTAVDLAEDERQTALAVNYLGPKYLAQAAQKYYFKLIHLSTDYVFNGLQKIRIKETVPAKPINYYGKTKYLGEEAVRTCCEQHLILRVSGVFSEYGKNFVKTILQLAASKEILSIVDDQIMCPTYASDIADAIYTILEKGLRKFGTYHYCNNGSVSWYNFAQAIVDTAKSLNFSPLAVKQIIPIKTAEFETRAKRPLYSVLDCTKIKKDFVIQQMSWQNGVFAVLKKMLASSPAVRDDLSKGSKGVHYEKTVST